MAKTLSEIDAQIAKLQAEKMELAKKEMAPMKEKFEKNLGELKTLLKDIQGIDPSFQPEAPWASPRKERADFLIKRLLKEGSKSEEELVEAAIKAGLGKAKITAELKKGDYELDKKTGKYQLPA